ncbi:MAG: polysaccharide biosynthesis protein [Oscillospiraceae bacterium]|nr:polysaccharide biosynthesis protein [Oscillospiraceae bacterium]
MKKQSFIGGALILTVSTMIVKVIGMFYKIPLGNILGAVGMSCFMTAYAIFTPVYSLSVSGFPAAISKMVSERLARGKRGEAGKVFRVSLYFLIALGLASFAVLFFGADALSAAIGNPDAALAVAAMAPSLFFCCIMAAVRGYYQGLGDMRPTALSQILESVFKLACGIAFALYFLNLGLAQFEQTGAVFGNKVADAQGAELAALPWAAAGALAGVSVSSVIGALYLLVYRLVKGRGIAREAPAKPLPGYGPLLRELVRVAFPVCLASMLAHVTSLVDVATVMHRIGAAMQADNGVVMAMYRHLLPAGLSEAGVPSYLYGAYQYTSSIVNLVPSITIALGVSALPVITAKWTVGNRRQTGEQIISVVKLSALIAIPAGLGISALSQPILELLYPSRMQEIAIAAPILRVMGVAAVLIGVTTPIASIFQAIGRPGVPVKLMAAGALIKVISNYVLVAVPALNINAVPVGTLLCYAFIMIVGLHMLNRELGGGLGLAGLFIKPVLCGIICAVSANTSYGLISRFIQSRAVVLLSVAIGGAFYLVFVLFLRIISKNEVLMLPKGKKIAKILEKLSLLR